MNVLVHDSFLLKRRIGRGSFGEIYSGEDITTGNPVAVKLEPAKTRSPQLRIESRIYQFLEGGVGIPQMHYYGLEPTGRYNAMVIDLLGLSLEDLKTRFRKPFSVKTVLMLADQMLACMEFVHKKHFVHRDIKPDNFMMGVNSKQGQVYIIDFGLSKRFEDPNTRKHISFTQHKSLTGTARYASINAMKGCEQSRRDDMESLGYVWMYLLRGALPWQGLPARTEKEKMDKILHVKETTRVDILCGGFPSEFGTFLREARALEFKEEPPYARWRAMFRDLYLRLGYCYDYAFDWTGRFDVVVEDKRADTQPTTARRSREGMQEIGEESPLVPQVPQVPQVLPPPPAETPALLPKRKNIINAIARPNYHLVGKRPGVRVDGWKAGFSKTTVGTARGVPAKRPGKYSLPNPHLSFAE